MNNSSRRIERRPNGRAARAGWTKVFLAAVIAFAAASFFAPPCPAAVYEATTIITGPAGSAPDEFHIKGPSETGHSLYFANGAPAICSAGNLLYILDAGNSRIKKYSLSGDFNSLVKLSADFEFRPEELCGLMPYGSGEVFVHTPKEIYRCGEDGKITARASLEGQDECHRIFEWGPKTFTAYDYKHLRIYLAAVDFEKRSARASVKFDNILFPWPVSSEEFLSVALPSPSELCVYRYRLPGEARSPAASLKIACGQFVSQFKFIGRDGRGNFYLRYFSDISEKIAVVSPALELVDAISMDARYSSGRSNALYDECVDRDGCVYTLFIDSDRLVVKKIEKRE